jgi:SagB-type dehydrogenase family enzyme
MPAHPGKAFQSKTVYHRDAMEDVELDWRTRPQQYKFCPHASVISLPQPVRSAKSAEHLDIWQSISERRTVRFFDEGPMALEQLSQLLWASAGTTAAYVTPHGQDFHRAAPSAGALYPIETYVVANRVTGLEPGLYHYRATGLDILERPTVEGSHALERLRDVDLSAAIQEAALDQPQCAKASAVFLWSAVFARTVWKYRERAYRYVYLDAGHMAAHVSLAATALGLAACPIGAFYDDEVNNLVELDGQEESVIYMMAVGSPAQQVIDNEEAQRLRMTGPKA